MMDHLYDGSVVTFPTGNAKKKVVFYGQEPTNGESTTVECVVNYQLLAVVDPGIRSNQHH